MFQRVFNYQKNNKNYMIKILKVVQQGQAFAVQSTKAENGQVMKCHIVLQELGGKYEDSYVATMLGPVAEKRFEPGQPLAVKLRFSTREYNGQVYQDIVVSEAYLIKN